MAFIKTQQTNVSNHYLIGNNFSNFPLAGLGLMGSGCTVPHSRLLLIKNVSYIYNMTANKFNLHCCRCFSYKQSALKNVANYPNYPSPPTLSHPALLKA